MQLMTNVMYQTKSIYLNIQSQGGLHYAHILGKIVKFQKLSTKPSINYSSIIYYIVCI